MRTALTFVRRPVRSDDRLRRPAANEKGPGDLPVAGAPRECT